MTSLPSLFLEKLIAKRLRDQGVTAPKSLPGKIAKHILSGNTEPFKYRGGKQAGDVTLTLKESDADEVMQAVEVFCDKQLPSLLPVIASRVSEGILKTLKSVGPMSTLCKKPTSQSFASDWKADGVMGWVSCECC